MGTYSADPSVLITAVRLTRGERKRLDALKSQRQTQTGKRVWLSDLLREALHDLMVREGVYHLFEKEK